MSTLSVIVPAHNAEAYIADCASSILSDLRPGDSLVIVDDGSTDDTHRIADEIATAYPQLVTVLDGGGCGVSAARNAGLAATSSDYVAFCDADDTYLPGAVAQMRTLLDSKPEVDIFVGGFRRDYPEGCTITDVKIVSATDALEFTLYQRPGWHESAWAKMYRRSVLATLGTVFIEKHRYEDLEATARIYLSARKIAFTPAPVYWYRYNDASFLASWTPARADALWATEEIEKTIIRHCPALLPAALSRRLSAAFNILALSSAAGDSLTASRAWHTILTLRRGVLSDKRVRLRNTTAAALSYLGRRCTACLSRIYESTKKS